MITPEILCDLAIVVVDNRIFIYGFVGTCRFVSSADDYCVALYRPNTASARSGFMRSDLRGRSEYDYYTRKKNMTSSLPFGATVCARRRRRRRVLIVLQ